MKIGIVSRFDVQEALELARKIIDELSSEELVLDLKSAEELGEEGTPIEEMNVEALITIGGDGTVLHTQQKAPEPPILGINMGGTGFLANVPPEDALKAADSLKKGDLEITELTKLSVRVSEERLPDALNEGVVRPTDPSKALTFQVSIDGEKVEEIRGDALIVATPTGSTAYASAAGGPIIDPRLEAFVLVPVSAGLSRTMPLVLPTSCEVRVSLLKSGRSASIIVDGKLVREANPGEDIIFNRSENPAKFFKWGGKFYEKARERL